MYAHTCKQANLQSTPSTSFKRVYTEKNSPDSTTNFINSPQNVQTQKLALRQTIDFPNQKSIRNTIFTAASLPNILAGNSYIKLNIDETKSMQKMFEKIAYTNNELVRNRSGSKKYKKGKQEESIKNIKTEGQQNKRLKYFRRKTTFQKQQQACKIADKSIVHNYTEVVQHNSMLKSKLLETEEKLRELQGLIKNRNPKLYEEKIRVLQLKLGENDKKIRNYQKQIKDLRSKLNQEQNQKVKSSTEIKDLKQKLNKEQIQKQSLENKLQQIQSEIEEYKFNNFNFNHNFDFQFENLDHSNIGMDMLSTAEFIENLSDLEQELHNKKTQIFELNKKIEQLKIREHCLQLRNEQNMRRVNQEWSSKYKRLMTIYKNVKSSNTKSTSHGIHKYGDTKNMKKSDKCDYVQLGIYEQKDELFNLSLSTDRSNIISH